MIPLWMRRPFPVLITKNRMISIIFASKVLGDSLKRGFMSVDRETIVNALERLLKLEEFSVENLAEVSRFNFRRFPPHDRKKIRVFLGRLRRGAEEHERRVQAVIARLRHES